MTTNSEDDDDGKKREMKMQALRHDERVNNEKPTGEISKRTNDVQYSGGGIVYFSWL